MLEFHNQLIVTQVNKQIRFCTLTTSVVDFVCTYVYSTALCTHYLDDLFLARRDALELRLFFLKPLTHSRILGRFYIIWGRKYDLLFIQ